MCVCVCVCVYRFIQFIYNQFLSKNMPLLGQWLRIFFLIIMSLANTELDSEMYRQKMN